MDFSSNGCHEILCQDKTFGQGECSRRVRYVSVSLCDYQCADRFRCAGGRNGAAYGDIRTINYIIQRTISSSGILRGVIWFKADVSGLPLPLIFQP